MTITQLPIPDTESILSLTFQTHIWLHEDTGGAIDSKAILAFLGKYPLKLSVYVFRSDILIRIDDDQESGPTDTLDLMQAIRKQFPAHPGISISGYASAGIVSL